MKAKRFHIHWSHIIDKSLAYTLLWCRCGKVRTVRNNLRGHSALPRNWPTPQEGWVYDVKV